MCDEDPPSTRSRADVEEGALGCSVSSLLSERRMYARRGRDSTTGQRTIGRMMNEHAAKRDTVIVR